MARRATVTPHIDPVVWRTGAVTVLGSVMSVLDTTIINVALDPLARELDAPVSDITWVVTAYLLAIAAVIPVTGWAARRIGTRRLYLASLALFTFGSLLCGLAWSVESLVAARVVQGLGGGMLLPVGQMITVRVAGREHLGRVMGVLAVPTVLAPVFGPTLGGVLLESVGWQALFLINLPIGAVALVAALRLLPRDHGGEAGPLDVVGLLLAPTGLALLTYGLSESATTSTLTDVRVLAPVVLSVLLLTAFVRHALRTEHPLLDLRLFTDRLYGCAATAVLLSGMVTLGGLILMPLYYQGVRDESSTRTGLLMVPTAVGVVVVLRWAGRMTDRYGGGVVATAGTVVLVVGTVPFLLLDEASAYAPLLVAMFVRGVGVGLAGMPLMTAALVALRVEQSGDASAQLHVLQRVGGSLGTALFVVLLQRQVDAGAGASAYGDAFTWVLVTTVLALFPTGAVALLERRRRAASPVVPDPVPALV